MGMHQIVVGALVLARVQGQCPPGWAGEMCLGSSGTLGNTGVTTDGDIRWEAGMGVIQSRNYDFDDFILFSDRLCRRSKLIILVETKTFLIFLGIFYILLLFFDFWFSDFLIEPHCAGGHSHYAVDPTKTAMLVIDPQLVYGACPENLTVEALVNPPSSETFEGQSPLCCEKFYDAVANQNALADAFRNQGGTVVVVAHVYRDVDGDGAVDNCGRICDFDVLGWSGWPKAWNLWNEAMPWSSVVFKTDDEPRGFVADPLKDYYMEKSTYSAMTDTLLTKLHDLGVDTIVVTGFMAQYCSVTTSRHAHDLGFKVIYVQDANDGPILPQLLSGIDENAAIPLYLGIAVADVTSTSDLLTALNNPEKSEL